MKQTAGKQIVMAEYQGRCDEKGTAVGHAPKVLEEYAGFLRPEYEARILAPRCVLEACGKSGRKGAKILPHRIVMKGHNSFFEKIANKVRMFANIRIVMKQAGVTTEDRKVVVAARERMAQTNTPCAAIELSDGRIMMTLMHRWITLPPIR